MIWAISTAAYLRIKQQISIKFQELWPWTCPHFGNDFSLFCNSIFEEGKKYSQLHMFTNSAFIKIIKKSASTSWASINFERRGRNDTPSPCDPSSTTPSTPPQPKAATTPIKLVKTSHFEWFRSHKIALNNVNGSYPQTVGPNFGSFSEGRLILNKVMKVFGMLLPDVFF